MSCPKCGKPLKRVGGEFALEGPVEDFWYCECHDVAYDELGNEIGHITNHIVEEEEMNHG